MLMLDERQFIQWLFKHDDQLLFHIFCMRIASCGQSSPIKQAIIDKGVGDIRDLLQKTIVHWQQAEKLGNVSPGFYTAVDKTIRKTLSYAYTPQEVSSLLKQLIEIYIKDNNPQGIYPYLAQITTTVNSLLPPNNRIAQERFQAFWRPVTDYDVHFAPRYYRTQLNTSTAMQALASVLVGIILMAVAAMLTQNLALYTGLMIIGGAFFTNYLVRSFWRFSAFTQYKATLSDTAAQESHNIILNLISLCHTASIPLEKPRPQSTSDDALDLVPAWHEQVVDHNESGKQATSSVKHAKPERTARIEKSSLVSEVQKSKEFPVIEWTTVPYIAKFDPKRPHITSVYPLHTNYFAHSILFGYLNPQLTTTMTRERFEHFRKVLERGRIIPRKSKGIQGIKPAFRAYRTVANELTYSDYKLKISHFNGRVFGREVATITLRDSTYRLVEFDGYDPKAHETLRRK